MRNRIGESFNEHVALKFQLYNSLFLTLPLDAVEQAGLLLPLLQEACENGFSKGESPTQIINSFLREHRAGFSEKDRISFLFKVIQYVERQIVLVDALEEAAYSKIHHIGESDAWEQIKNKVKAKGLEMQMQDLLSSFGIRVVLTAHPTQFYPGAVLGIVTDLTDSITEGDFGLTRNLLQQLGKTPFYRKKKPTAFDEANSLTWYLSNIFYPAVGELLDRIEDSFTEIIDSGNKLITLGFWPGGDRDGNPFVTVDTTRNVARHLRTSIAGLYFKDIKALKRRLSFPGISEIINQIADALNNELTHPDGEKNVDLNFLIERLNEIEKLLTKDHQSLFLDKLKSFKRKVQLFGFYFASIDIRQDSRVISKAFDAILAVNKELLPDNFSTLHYANQLDLLLKLDKRIDISGYDDSLIKDTLESFKVIREIQHANGEQGAHRFIISNCRGSVDVAKVFALAKICAWSNEELSLDIVPLFETVNDLQDAGNSMRLLYKNTIYSKHLAQRKKQQTVMLGFSDGTKDGGYLMANWSIYKAKEAITEVSRKNDIEVLFFDGRGGPPARGGGNTHLFYSAMGKTIESKQIQITVQGQTISSHYGIKEAAVHNLGHLLTAGIENNLYKRTASNLNHHQRSLIAQLSKSSYLKYEALKNHELFIPFLEERSTLKYYGMANIGSRPSKRGTAKQLKFEDLRAIPFVGAWSQLKQNVPGFFGVGTALKEQEEKGNLSACRDLYRSSIFFKTLLSNSMQSMSKTNFDLTRYMMHDKKFGEFWKLIYHEFLLSKEMVLKVSGQAELLEDNARSRMSIDLREKVVLPLLTIQQYALIEIQKAVEMGNEPYLVQYERMVMRSLFGNINASRNSV